MAWEGRKYKLDKSEGFDEYMKALGKCQTIQLDTPNYRNSYHNSRNVHARHVIYRFSSSLRCLWEKSFSTPKNRKLINLRLSRDVNVNQTPSSSLKSKHLQNNRNLMFTRNAKNADIESKEREGKEFLQLETGFRVRHAQIRRFRCRLHVVGLLSKWRDGRSMNENNEEEEFAGSEKNSSLLLSSTWLLSDIERAPNMQSLHISKCSYLASG